MEQTIKSKKKNRYNQGDVVRIISTYNESLKPWNNYWGQIKEVYDYCYTIITYKGEVAKVTHNDLELIVRASKQAASLLIRDMSELLKKYGNDPDFTAYLEFLGTKPVPGASKLTIDWFNFLLAQESQFN